MGEFTPVRIVRAAGAAALVAAAAVALTSCSALGGGAAAAGATASAPVLDPSVSSASPTEAVASDTPLPTPTATVTPTDGTTSSASTRTAVVPFVTTADWDASAKALDVSAIVPGVVESNGTCTVTVSSGATTRTAKSDGVAASSYTGCEAVSFPGLAAGTWKVSVRYESAKSAGTSAVGSVHVG